MSKIQIRIGMVLLAGGLLLTTAHGVNAMDPLRAPLKTARRSSKIPEKGQGRWSGFAKGGQVDPTTFSAFTAGLDVSYVRPPKASQPSLLAVPGAARAISPKTGRVYPVKVIQYEGITPRNESNVLRELARTQTVVQPLDTPKLAGVYAFKITGPRLRHPIKIILESNLEARAGGSAVGGFKVWAETRSGLSDLNLKWGQGETGVERTRRANTSSTFQYVAQRAYALQDDLDRAAKKEPGK